MQKSGRRFTSFPHHVVVLVAFGVVVRLLLVAFGRFYVDDGFYLANAFRIGLGHRPFEDFVHVAFPLIEACYAPLLAAADDRLAAASLLTGAVVILTSIGVAIWARRVAGPAAGFIAGAAYQVAAPVIAFHLFQRELWTNAGIAWAGALLFASRGHGDRRAATVGLLLALTVTFKLTAVVPAGALLVALLVEARRREALIAAGFGAAAFLATVLVFAARYQGEFVSQVFLFYFFKGSAAGFAARALTFTEHLSPVLLFGGLGLALVRGPALRPARVVALAWLLHYSIVSSSFWDHNVLDFAVPAAIGAGALAARWWESRRRAVLAAVILGTVAVGTYGIGERRPHWYPAGWGEHVPPLARAQVALLAEKSTRRDRSHVPTPMTAVVAGRVSFVGDYELEPVARGLVIELRRRGLAATWALREDGVAFGAPPGVPIPPVPENRFVARVFANSLIQIAPRLIDAARARELAVLLQPLPSGVAEEALDHGYTKVEVGRVRALLRDDAPAAGVRDE